MHRPSTLALLAWALLGAAAPEGEWVVQRGDTLASVAARRYVDERFAPVLKAHNRLGSDALTVGSTLSAPPLPALVEQEAFRPEVAPLARRVAEAAEVYHRHRKAMVAARGASRQEVKSGPGRVQLQLDPQACAELKQASQAVAQAADGLLALGAPMQPPKKAAGQLRTAAQLMASLSTNSSDDYLYDVVEVETRLGNGLAYLILWAQAGYR